MSHHAFAAYSSTQARIMDEMIDVFPYRQYLSTKDGNVRPAHAALHHIILRADHPFWKNHTPPWEWNCRCQVVELTAEDRDEEHARDKHRLPEDRRVLEGPHLAQLETGSLNRGASTNVDIRTPKQRGGTYEWSASDTNLPYEQIRTRWTPDVANGFESWADKVKLDGGGSLLDHLSGSHPAVNPVKTLGFARAATFTEALTRSGLAAKDAWTRADLANLRGHLRVENPALAADLISGVTGAREAGVLVSKEIHRTVQDLLDILPRDIAATLPKVRITLAKHLIDDHGKKIPGVTGDYRPEGLVGGPRIRISMEALRGFKGEARRREMRRILSHELMHWLHQDAIHAQAATYRKAIASHYSLRTAGSIEEPDGKGGFFRADHFWNRYAGREYKWENSKPSGLEIPSTYFELWETPEKAIKAAHANDPNSAAFRETFSLVHSIFNSTP